MSDTTDTGRTARVHIDDIESVADAKRDLEAQVLENYADRLDEHDLDADRDLVSVWQEGDELVADLKGKVWDELVGPEPESEATDEEVEQRAATHAPARTEDAQAAHTSRGARAAHRGDGGQPVQQDEDEQTDDGLWSEAEEDFDDADDGLDVDTEDDVDADEIDHHETDGRTAARPLQALYRGLYLVTLAPLIAVLKWLPGTQRIPLALMRGGFRAYRKLSKSDVIALSAYGDKALYPRGADWNSADTEYRTTNGETYSAAAEGHTPYRLFGDVPVIFTLRGAPEVFEPIQGYLAQQQDMGKWIATRDGENAPWDIFVGADPPNGADGNVISWEKAWEQYYQKISQEDLEEQLDAGRIMEMDSDDRKWALYLVGAVILGGVLTIAIIFVFSNFIGGGGGGGGGSSSTSFLSTAASLAGWV